MVNKKPVKKPKPVPLREITKRITKLNEDLRYLNEYLYYAYKKKKRGNKYLKIGRNGFSILIREADSLSANVLWLKTYLQKTWSFFFNIFIAGKGNGAGNGAENGNGTIDPPPEIPPNPPPKDD